MLPFGAPPSRRDADAASPSRPVSTMNAQFDLPSNKLYFAGLPDSLTEATFRAMMEKFPGFAACRLRHDRKGQWVGFVDFQEESEATACKEAMGGAKLDPNNDSVVTVRYSGQQKVQQQRGLAQLGMLGGGDAGALAGSKRGFEPSFEPPPPPGPPPGWNGAMGGGGPMGDGMGGGMADVPPPPGPPPGWNGPMDATNEVAPLPAGPPPGAAPLGAANRLIVVEGLPADGTSRELTQLFRFLPGFVKVEGPTQDAKAEEASSGDASAKRFTVEFVSPTDAGAAIAVRQGLLFDPAQPASALKIGFAPKAEA